MILRYTLRREFMFGSGRMVWIMLNPSTATDNANDPTIRRCIGFALAWGYRAMDVGNLSPVRATDPAEIKTLIEPAHVWSKNLDVIKDVVRDADLVVAAWGVHGEHHDRAKAVVIGALEGVDLYCLGKTKDGHPKHPLRVSGKTKPQLFRAKDRENV